MGPMKELLTNAMHEISELRHRNEILTAKVEMIDLFACVLHTTAATRSQGAAPDVAWALQKEIDEITKEENDNAHQGHSGGRVDESRSARNGG